MTEHSIEPDDRGLVLACPKCGHLIAWFTHDLDTSFIALSVTLSSVRPANRLK
jgi:hypothetical protein